MATRRHDASRATATGLLSRRRSQRPVKSIQADNIERPPIASADKSAIVVISPQVLIRDCLVRCLKTENPNCAVFAFTTVAEWLETATEHPSIAVIVLCLQDRKQTDVQIEYELSLLANNRMDVPIVIISDAEDIEHVVSGLEGGARGYIPTSVSLDVAIGAMHLVEAGGTFAPVTSLISWKRMGESTAAQNENLKELFTPRQAAVLGALRQGKANKQIAYDLNMREGTVKVHIRNIMRKLKAKNRTEVAVLASGLFTDAEAD
jgi:DNA-binding NarL/FixJ family response regulator